MKVILANPPWTPGSCRAASRWPHKKENEFVKPSSLDNIICTLGRTKDSKEIVPYSEFPFYLGYAAAILEQNGHKVKLIDSLVTNQTRNGFLIQVKNYSPDVIVFETSTPSFKNDIELLKDVSRITKCKKVLCGPHVSALPEETLKSEFVDFVLIGEYEISLNNLIECIEKRTNLEDVKGIAFKSGRKVVKTPLQPIVDLDKLPFPAWHLMPLKRYYNPAPGTKTTMEVMSSRGCPYKCTYCIYPQLMYRTSQVRFRKPENVVDEIEILIKKYGKRGIYFNDDTFALTKKHVLAICQEIKKRRLNFRWACFGRVDTIDYEMLKEMKNAGCVYIQYGVESGSQKILGNIKKGIRIEQIKNAFKMTYSVGIKAHGTFMIGLPGESKETIKETMKLISEIDCDSLVFALCTPFPGTEMYREASEKNWLEESDWEKYDGYNFVVMRTEYMSRKEIKAAFDYIRKWWEVYRKMRKKDIKRFIKTRYREDGIENLLKVGLSKSIELMRDVREKKKNLRKMSLN